MAALKPVHQFNGQRNAYTSCICKTLTDVKAINRCYIFFFFYSVISTEEGSTS